jgi:bifunctional non-homologous end joining protein LigD
MLGLVPARSAPVPSPWREGDRAVQPMLASTVEVPLRSPEFVYEPKYDGVRTLASLIPGRPRPSVRLWSRLGNDKTAQFPEVVRALTRFASTLRVPLLLDGEIVAIDERGRPVGFQHLQGRIHVKNAAAAAEAPVVFIAFDLLREGQDDLRPLPLTARRARLERVFGDPGSPVLRLSSQVAGDGRELYQEAISAGWEGLIAKRASSPYLSGRRSPDWSKLKLVRAQEFVIGGWTSPRGARSHFGSLLLGVYDGDDLVYVGHVGTGFNEKELQKLMRLLGPLAISRRPFASEPPTNDTPHWVKPELVAEVKFTEWTNDNKLRHPTYLGLRDDVEPRRVRRESGPQYSASALGRLDGAGNSSRSDAKPLARRAGASAVAKASADSPEPPRRRLAPAKRKPSTPTTSKSRSRSASRSGLKLSPELQLVIDQLDEFERARRKGPIVLPDGDKLDVGNLEKVFWPEPHLTKGDLLRYYVRVSPYLLPVVEDRPLVMKRYPNGVTGQAFYQHRAPEPIPQGVRAVTLPNDDVPSRLVGGSLKTLLYLAQLAAISQDPWFSRIQSPGIVDHIAFDLDPMPGTSFETVLDVARWLRDELERLDVVGCPKTSGADGLHVYVKMPEDTPYEAGRLWAQIVATMVATRHPDVATTERVVRRRGAKVYVDYLQNIEGKTLACAYSGRASAFAGASTPVTWREIDAGFDRRDFTIQTLPDRLASVGDLWKTLRTGPAVNLHEMEKYFRKQGRS